MDWETAVIEGIEARQDKDKAQWKLGDLARQVKTNYSDHTLENYAALIGVEYNTLQEYRRVAGAYEKSTRVDNLTWSHHRAAIGWEFSRVWLDKAAENQWGVHQMEVERARVETEVSPVTHLDVDVEETESVELGVKRQQLEELLSDPAVATDPEALESVAEHVVRPAYEGAGLTHDNPYNHLRLAMDTARMERSERDDMRVRRIKSESPVAQKFDEWGASLELQSAIDKLVTTITKMLAKVGPPSDRDRDPIFGLTGSLARLDEASQLLHRYLELDEAELDEFLRNVLNKDGD
jgi:hypothetical protein